MRSKLFEGTTRWQFCSKMEGYSAFVLLLLCAGTMGQPTSVTLAAVKTPVTEGTDTAITYTCTLDMASVTDLSFPLEFELSSTSENGFDHGTIADYCCTVSAGTTVGSVSIPLINDVVIDSPTASETLNIKLANQFGLTAVPIATVAVMIMPDTGDTTKLVITPRMAVVKAKENSATAAETTATVTFDFIDKNGIAHPLEDDITITISALTVDTGTATVTADYTIGDATLTISHATGAAPVLSATATFPIVNENPAVLENLETANFVLGDPAAPVASITAVGSPVIQVQIIDDDLLDLIAFQEKTPRTRHSKEDATIFAVSSEPSSATWDLTDSRLGHNLRDCKRKLRVVNNHPALELTVPRPERNSKARYNEFTFTREQTMPVGGTKYQRTVRSFVTPTSPKKKGVLPIETNVDSVLVVYPNAKPCTALAQTYCINITCTPLTRRQIKWSFIAEGSTDEKTLKSNNGKDTLQIKECGKAGLYIAGRRGRRKTGWIDYVRVIQAECPSGKLATACTADTGLDCKNQGVQDQELGVCICRPGFAGVKCELEQTPGTFGSQCQFKLSDYIKEKKNQKGKCIKFSFPNEAGVTCAAGYGGKDCCSECKRGWNFGANCAQTCHCVDDLCDPKSGRCINGCAPGKKGFNCQ